MVKIKMPIPHSAFTYGLLLLIFKVLFSSSMIIPYGDIADSILEVIAAGCFILSIVSKRLSPKTLYVYAIFAILGIITAFNTGSMFVFLTMLTCLAIRGEELEKIIRFTFFYEMLIVLVRVAVSILTYLAGYTEYMVMKGDSRLYFGFTHPNVFSIFLLNNTVMWAWLNYDKLTIKKLLFLLCIHAFFSFLTECRTSVIAMAVLLVCFCIFHNSPKSKRLLAISAATCVPVLALMMYVLISQYHTDATWVKIFDKILSSRIKLGAYALENYGLSIIGQNMLNVRVIWDEYWQLNGHTFDNVYTYIMINYGVIWLVVLSFIFAKIANKGQERDEIMILLWAAYGMTEVHPLNPFNFFPLMLVSRLYRDNSTSSILNEVRRKY